MSGNASGIDPQLVRVNKLELVERLADDLAHEIKNPLHSMVINLEVLKRRILRAGGSEPDELMRYTGVLGTELDRVNRRVELLLRMVRPDPSGELTSLGEAIADLLELLELERERHSLQVRYEPAGRVLRGHLPREVARQLVLNLLLHAMDSVRPGGDLLIRTAADETRVRLDVDAGPAADDARLEDERVAVVRALVDALGGALDRTVASGPEGPERLHLSLSLPLAHPPR